MRCAPQPAPQPALGALTVPASALAGLRHSRGVSCFLFSDLSPSGVHNVYENEDREGGERRQKKSSFILQSVGLLRFHLFISQSARVKWAPLHPVTWMDEAPYDC